MEAQRRWFVGLLPLLAFACGSEAPSGRTLPDQQPGCGDGVRAGAEQCDGADLQGRTCAALGYDGGALACRADCAFDVSGCTGTGPVCQNGAAEGLEVCDQADLRDADCLSLGYTSGQLACTTGCTLDTSGCTIASAELETAVGCAGVFNPEQLLDYELTMSPADWQTVLGDTTYSIERPANLRCVGLEPQSVGVRRKRSGGTHKVGLKIDINALVAGQRYFGLKSLTWENGSSSGSASDGAIGDVVTEYLAWRVFARSGAAGSRAALMRLTVNGAAVGVYANVESVDKTFLASRFIDDSGWLYKKSGGDGDGLKTHESDGLAEANPYDDYFCFWGMPGPGACAVPGDLATSLPQRLQLDQMLRVGAVNALLGNTDSPILKDNNYFYYDWAGGRAYLPWDLDTVMQSTYDVFTGNVPGGVSSYRDVLYSHWEDDYDQILTDLLAGPLALAIIHAEIDRVGGVAGAALDADPFAEGAPISDDLTALRSWWTSQHGQVQDQLDAH